MDEILPIAERIITKCGGAPIVANWLKVTPKTVYCWTYSKKRGGTGGVIPQKYHSKLIKKAYIAGTELAIEDFFYGFKLPNGTHVSGE